MTDRAAYEYYLDPAHLEVTGPARKHPKDELTEFLTVRLSPSMLSQVKAAAEQEGRTAGSWVRQVIRLELMADARRRRDAVKNSSDNKGGNRDTNA